MSRLCLETHSSEFLAQGRRPSCTRSAVLRSPPTSCLRSLCFFFSDRGGDKVAPPHQPRNGIDDVSSTFQRTIVYEVLGEDVFARITIVLSRFRDASGRNCRVLRIFVDFLHSEDEGADFYTVCAYVARNLWNELEIP